MKNSLLLLVFLIVTATFPLAAQNLIDDILGEKNPTYRSSWSADTVLRDTAESKRYYSLAFNGEGGFALVAFRKGKQRLLHTGRIDGEQVTLDDGAAVAFTYADRKVRLEVPGLEAIFSFDPLAYFDKDRFYYDVIVESLRATTDIIGVCQI